MSVTLRANDSINLTTGVVTRSDVPKSTIEYHRARLAENHPSALAWFIRRSK